MLMDQQCSALTVAYLKTANLTSQQRGHRRISAGVLLWVLLRQRSSEGFTLLLALPGSLAATEQLLQQHYGPAICEPEPLQLEPDDECRDWLSTAAKLAVRDNVTSKHLAWALLLQPYEMLRKWFPEAVTPEAISQVLSLRSFHHPE